MKESKIIVLVLDSFLYNFVLLYEYTVNKLEGRVCYGGLDLSSTTDITAFVLVFPPEDEDDKYTILPYFWIPEETL